MIWKTLSVVASVVLTFKFIVESLFWFFKGVLLLLESSTAAAS